MAIIPESDLNMNGEIVEEEFNNKTYKIDFSSNKIRHKNKYISSSEKGYLL